MISASRYVAESRNALLDETTESTADVLKLVLSDGEEMKAVTSLVVFCDETSAIVGNILDRRTAPSAQIMGQKCVYSKLYRDKLDNLVVEMVTDVPENVLLQWMKILHTFAPSFVFTMSSSSQILSSSVEGSLRTLITADISAAIKSERMKDKLNFKNKSEVVDAVSKLEKLQPGSVITGMVASVISFCEARSLPAVSIICCRRAAITFHALRLFEVSLPVLHAALKAPGLGSVVIISTVTAKEYLDVVRKDSFALMSENIYT